MRLYFSSIGVPIHGSLLKTNQVFCIESDVIDLVQQVVALVSLCSSLL